ncbi:AAA family ATPase [Geothrix campi]|jgi:MoxR-like ATPase|uniref:AAA family ATPase n=1 Tax=Geothrix campi TaxID=2966450 RepID=UPI002147E62B|nr:AAA family ATPase [Geothrix sp. SG10]
MIQDPPQAPPVLAPPVRSPEGIRPAARAGLTALQAVVVGKNSQVRRAFAALLAGGHVLLEDLPGVGKTTLAKGLSRILGGSFQRVQGTNDLLPSDLLGVHLWDAKDQAFRFQPGPVFCQVLLLDELNRIGPKTQSAMLEAMVEGQVTLDRSTHRLPDPFFVIATQNPLDHAGTFPLPESQLDRFSCSLHLGYPDREAERRILKGEAGSERLDGLHPALDLEGWRQARAAVRAVRIAEAVMDYAERMVDRIRTGGGFCSTRAVKHWLGLAQAEAWLDGRDFITPDDLQATLADTMAHRGSLDDRRLNRTDRRDQLARLVKELPVGWAG